MHIRDFIDKVGQNFTSREAAALLEVSPLQTTRVLYKWIKSGWIQRQSRGIYTVIPLSKHHQSNDNPWSLIPKIVGSSEYYICGWSAAEYLNLTEQIFNDISVATYTSRAKRSVPFAYGRFIFCTTNKKNAFGTKIVWIGSEKIPISDIHKTIVDIVTNPAWGGGIVHVFDCLKNYVKLRESDWQQVIKYGDALGNGAFFKRLGFYLDHILGSGNEVSKKCHARITSGYSYLDPAIKGVKYVASWQIIVPEGLKLGEIE